MRNKKYTYPIGIDGKEITIPSALMADEALILKKFTNNLLPVIEHFSKNGLTQEQYILAVTKDRSLPDMSPNTIISRVEDSYKKLEEKLAKNGIKLNEHITLDDYIQAAVKQPSLFRWSPDKVVNNASNVYDYFETKFGKNTLQEKNITFIKYLKETIKKNPSLLYQNPQTLINNIEDVGKYFEGNGEPQNKKLKMEDEGYNFKDKGFKLVDYFEAAIKYPTLFIQTPQKTIDNIEIISTMYLKELFAFYPQGWKPKDFKPQKPDPNDLSPVFNYIFHSPDKLGLSSANLKTRMLASYFIKRDNNGITPSTSVLHGKS